MSFKEIRALESERSHVERRSRKPNNECMSTAAYCVISIAFFLFAGLINTPSFIGSIPGGTFTTAILGIGIFVCAIMLCMRGRPRKIEPRPHKPIIEGNRNCQR